MPLFVMAGDLKQMGG